MRSACARRPLLGGLAAIALLAAVPGRGWTRPDGGASQPPRELIVFAAASLRETFEALGRTFEAAHPDVKVRFNLAGSQELRFQIQQGAKADVFAGADLVHARALEEAGLIDKPRIFARNLPVVVVPKGNPSSVKTFADLPRARRLVIGSPEVPIGRYTLQILARAGKTNGEAFARAVEKNIASRELNVRQVLAKVTLGEADAGIVYRTDAIAARDTVEIVEIPTALNVIAEYPVAPLKAAAQPALAEAWCELLLSSAGRAALARSGFLPDELATATSPASGPTPGSAPGSGPRH
jgi:molybdate transport system substrate-binding protein